ncbi:transposase (plasmid) [Candidatus Protochlamydia naegleriophila]|uniref:Transposase n=1 Tax=Candidatus Protochlamydia naegleriophila TaxID=389348 RepID=A0A0U5JJH3_9BACT|nr:transposase [Candidatus Protochlamydia naegleriophila]
MVFFSAGKGGGQLIDYGYKGKGVTTHLLTDGNGNPINFEVTSAKGDEMWSFVGSKSNDQWLWLVMHSSTRQILAFHVGKRNKAAGEALMAKLPEELKKKPTFTQISSRFTMKLSHGRNIVLSAKNLGRQVTLKDLIARSDRDVQD